MMPQNPYKGLAPYDQHDQYNFFGRDHEKEVLLGQILSHKTTLLYAASGVGKSSLLGAAIIPELEALDQENLDVAYYRTWIDDPIRTIQNTVKQTLCERKKITPDELHQLDNCALPEFFDRCADYGSDPLVLILDQFEELFRYHAKRPDFFPFIDQLAEVMTDQKLPVTVVLAMREDFLAELSIFRGRVPELLDNGYRLQKLAWHQAQEAIVKPVEQDTFGFRYEAELLDVLLRDLAEDPPDPAEVRRAARPRRAFAAIEGAYLQIVCAELWRREQDNPEKMIRKATYDALGGADAIVKRYFEQTMGQFTPSQRRLASRAFSYLVTEWGTKMAYPEPVLARILNVKQPRLQSVLETLKSARILRDETRPEGTWYELYHDVFANIVEEWSHAFRQRQRRRLRLGLVALLLSLFCTLGVVSYQGYQLAQRNARIERNAGTLHVQNELGATLTLDCIRHYGYERTCPAEAIEVKGSTVNLPGPADYQLTAATADWRVNYPVYIEGVTHQLSMEVAAPPAQIPAGMAYIPAGVFRMGDKNPRDVKGLEDEQPAHDADVAGFYMDTHEVTNTQYESCVQAGVCTSPHYESATCFDPEERHNDPVFQAADKPVVCVAWQQATTFCEHVAKRLPTEAEWEKAAAGPQGYMWSFGNRMDTRKANTTESGPDHTQPVGTYPANGYGLYDMSGNVEEWVQDWYVRTFYARSAALDKNPENRDPGAGRRVKRGGAWWHNIDGARTTRRYWDDPQLVSTLAGFRCVQPLDQASRP